MEKKPSLLANKDTAQIKKELDKDIKKLKPKKPPSLKSNARVDKMAKKAVETDMEELKGMLKDELIIEHYKERLKETKQKSSTPPATSSSSATVPTSTIKQQKTSEEDIFEGIKPKDLKGVKDDALEKFVKLKMLSKNPELAPYLKEQSNDSIRDKILDKIIEKAFNEGSSASKESQTDNIIATLLTKLLENAFNQNKPNTDMEMYTKMHEREMAMMERLSEEKEARWAQRFNDLAQSIPPNPFNWLAQEKAKQEQLRGFFAGSTPSDLQGELALKQQDQKHELELLEAQNRIEKDRMEHSKSSDMTNLIKDGIATFTEKLSESVGGAIGQLGKEQLGQVEGSGMPSTIPLEQVEQAVNLQPQLPRSDPFLNIPPTNMFHPANSNIPLNQQPTTNEKPKKKYGGGFQYHGK